MYCPKCGKELKGTPKFCSGCGAPLNHVAKKETDTALIRKISAKVEPTETMDQIGLTGQPEKARSFGGIKIAAGVIGAAVIAAAVGTGIYMFNGHSTGTSDEKETIAKEKEVETSEDQLSETEAAESEETESTAATAQAGDSVEEINKQAVAKYREFLTEKAKLSFEEGGCSDFAVMDVNGDGILEMTLTNESMPDAYAAGFATTFVYYHNGVLYAPTLDMPWGIYDYSTGKIGAYYIHSGSTILYAYDYDGAKLKEIGNWEMADLEKYNTSVQMSLTMQEIDEKTGTKYSDSPIYCKPTQENIDKYLTGSGKTTGYERDDHPFSSVFQFALDAVIEQENEMEEKGDGQQSADSSWTPSNPNGNQTVAEINAIVQNTLASGSFAYDGEKATFEKCMEGIRCIETDRLYEQSYKVFAEDRPQLDDAFRQAGYRNAVIAYFYDPSAEPYTYSEPVFIGLTIYVDDSGNNDPYHYEYYIRNGQVVRRVAPEATTDNVPVNFFIKALIEDGAKWHQEGGMLN